MNGNLRTYVRILLIASLLLAGAAALARNSVAAGSSGDAGSGAGVQDAPQGAPTNQLIVKYKDSARLSGLLAPAGESRMQALSAAAGATLTYLREMSGDAHVLRLLARLPEAEVADMARRIAALPDVEYAEPDRILFPTLTPNDTNYGSQWHYFEAYGINAPAAWDITTGSASIKIAVIDTGITDHTDLAGRWVGGYDFINDALVGNDGDTRDSNPHDPGDWITSAEAASGYFAGCQVTNSSWHGTHVAGTIGANSNNSAGVAGINWVSQIVPVRVLGKCGGYNSDIIDGMRWAAGLSVSGVPANANPAKVLNMSLGGSGLCSTTQQGAIYEINAAGSIVVVAAGNSNANASNFNPANCNGVITVASNDRDGHKASYSNYGSVVEVSAPGGETGTSSPSPAPQNGVLSTLNTGITMPVTSNFVYYQGTSMAAPHVAGVVSLMTSISSTLNFTQSLQVLQSTVRAFPAGSTCLTTYDCGDGIVDAAAALNALGSPFVPTDFVYLPTVVKNYPQAAPSGPTPGFWESATGDEFYVSTDQANVLNFAIYVNVSGCGVLKITRITPVPITGSSFSFSGSYYASGTFDSSTSAHGTDGLTNYYSTTCGVFLNGGPWNWTATWQNSSQPSAATVLVDGPVYVEQTPTAQADFHSVNPTK